MGFSFGGGGGGGVPWSKIGASVGELGNFGLSMRQNDKAADALIEENRNYLELLDRERSTQDSYLKPFLEGGKAGWQKIVDLYTKGTGTADFMKLLESSPDYQFARSQGEQALARKQSATGNRLSPGASKELIQYNQGAASMQLGNVLERLFRISDTGRGAANGLVQVSQNYADRYGGGLMDRGDIKASEYLGVSAINDRYNQRMQSIWGMGDGGGDKPMQQPGRGSNGYSNSFNNMNTGSTTQGFSSGSSYNYPSTAQNFKWY